MSENATDTNSGLYGGSKDGQMRMYMGEHPGMPGDGRYLFTVGGRSVVGNHNGV